jgi:metal-responsive CopG/Arc/MetJ family transcriptional regulator
MRMPKDMLAEIDRVVAETGRNRNEILMLSIEFALENMEIVKE